MGAGQIGGIATLVDIDFRNAAGFLGEPAKSIEGQHIVHYLSHAMIFCVGALLEAHVVLTPAICVYGERYKFHVFAGTHKFIDGPGISRQVNHLCVHRVLGQQFSFNSRESGSDFLPNRVRYGTTAELKKHIGDTTCHYFGWGSRRNGYLVPLLINLLRVDATILPDENCLEIWNNQEKFLCLQQPRIMTSRLIDRPCGVGFLDLSLYNKFLTCSIDDSRDVIDIDEEFMSFDYKGISQTPATRPMVTVNINETTDETP
ncbi:unnamed protein product [Leptidea sinapis]|uniref:Uncharacterized protein n=1 Tax=Leptidea sinapis TaxID=189913 RepID=A0A5E4QS45_9NEOP|nr:unnamed protein product [Leptidea sinapis]